MVKMISDNEWLYKSIGSIQETVKYDVPTVFNENKRIIPAGVSAKPGAIRFCRTPYLKEIIDCFDIDSPVREINLLKGVQIGWSTVIESGILYWIFHIGGTPVLYFTATQKIAANRIDSNIIPMINASGYSHMVASPDETSNRKTGKTKDKIFFSNGSSIMPIGAQSPEGMRDVVGKIIIKDEFSAWPDTDDGDSDALTDSRAETFWRIRKICRGSTPTLEGSCKSYRAYLKGDQRLYMVNCLKCGYSQHLRWSGKNDQTNREYGIKWDYNDNMTLAMDSVRYLCFNCGHEHFDNDKIKWFSDDAGAHWEPTETPISEDIRSYKLPALYSTFAPWSKHVMKYLEAWDQKTKQVIHYDKYQVFYNNVLAEPFRDPGGKISTDAVDSNRRPEYSMGEIPNAYALQHTGSPILFLTCQVDVHKSNLAVMVMGWARNNICFVIDYWRFERDKQDEDCRNEDHPVWDRLRDLIVSDEDKPKYRADDGKKYDILMTLVDCGDESYSTVIRFCQEFDGGVFPVKGAAIMAKSRQVNEFAPFATKDNTRGYNVMVDHYKNRIARSLRREWIPDYGNQRTYTINFPGNISGKQLKEYAAESLREKKHPDGSITHYWHRVSGRENEAFDLTVYGFAAVDIIAWTLCLSSPLNLETVDWDMFWDFIETNELYYDTET